MGNRVPSSYAFLDALVEGVEDFTPHFVKSDGGVVSLSAVVSATDARGFQDEDTAWTDPHILGTEQFNRNDADTALVVASITTAELYAHGYTDAATTSLVGVASGAEVFTH